jgi:hypothetical protein
MPEHDVTYAVGSYYPETFEAESPEEVKEEDKS